MGAYERNQVEKVFQFFTGEWMEIVYCRKKIQEMLGRINLKPQ